MITYIITLVFVLSVAIAAGSILIASKLRNAGKADFFSSMIFYLTFYYTYGFYALWGHLIVVSFLSPFLTNALLGKTIIVLAMLGAPFVVFAWLMLIKLTMELAGRPVRNAFFLWFLTGNTLLAVSVGYVCSKYLEIDHFTVIRYGFMILNLGYTLTGAAILRYSKNKKMLLRKRDTRKIAMGLLLVMLFQNGTIYYYSGNIYVALVFILIFFLGGAFIPVYIRYESDLSILRSAPENRLSFDALCRNFDISPREKDIMFEICQGLSNQQIADKLFISLQTVKDHTHRIYYKTNCTGRVQLITMVNATRNSRPAAYS